MSPLVFLLIGFAAGEVLCFVIGWLVGSRRSATAVLVNNRLEDELRQQLTQREAELAQTREQLSQTSTARATAEAQKAAADNLLAEQRQIHELSLREARQSQEKALVECAFQEGHRLIGIIQSNPDGGYFQKGCVGRINNFQDGGLFQETNEEFFEYKFYKYKIKFLEHYLHTTSTKKIQDAA